MNSKVENIYDNFFIKANYFDLYFYYEPFLKSFIVGTTVDSSSSTYSHFVNITPTNVMTATIAIPIIALYKLPGSSAE